MGRRCEKAVIRKVIPTKPRLRENSAKPAALLLSHCIPDARRASPGARSWQLLNLLSRTHDIYLTCVSDGPVHFHHWQALGGLTRGLILEPLSPWRRWLARGVGWVDRVHAEELRLASALTASLALWTKAYSFSTVLCTHPGLWHAAAEVPASEHACDLAEPVSLRHERSAVSVAAELHWWHRRQTDHRSALEEVVASECDLVLCTGAEAAHRLLGVTRRTLIVPPGIDGRDLAPWPLADVDASSTVEDDAAPVAAVLARAA
jgi:hypothetical protein